MQATLRTTPLQNLHSYSGHLSTPVVDRVSLFAKPHAAIALYHNPLFQPASSIARWPGNLHDTRLWQPHVSSHSPSQPMPRWLQSPGAAWRHGGPPLDPPFRATPHASGHVPVRAGSYAGCLVSAGAGGLGGGSGGGSSAPICPRSGEASPIIPVAQTRTRGAGPALEKGSPGTRNWAAFDQASQAESDNAGHRRKRRRPAEAAIKPPWAGCRPPAATCGGSGGPGGDSGAPSGEVGDSGGSWGVRAAGRPATGGGEDVWELAPDGDPFHGDWEHW